MITIHYRPLAHRRVYESVCLPIAPRLTKSYAVVAPRPDPLGGAVARGARPCLLCGRPIGLDDQAQRTGCCSGACAREYAANRIGATMRPRAATTTEIPIAVDATLPAIAGALERLRTSLTRNGTAAQLLAVESISKAVVTARASLADVLFRGVSEHDIYARASRTIDGD